MSGRRESEPPSPLGGTSAGVLATPAPAASSDKLLQHLLDDEVDLDLAFDRIVSSEQGDQHERQMLKATMPGDCLRSDEISLATLLASVLSEYRDIEQLIEGFREDDSSEGGLGTEAVAVVSEDELAHPERLSQALSELHEKDKFEFLFDTAKGALDQLDVYGLSRQSPDALVSVLRSESKLRTVESLVDFLRSLNTAAETFQAMDLPDLHIREYLRHLYLMRDWKEMARLVGLLEVAVSNLVEASSPQPGGR
ncbi:MAG: hypothetical protein AAGM22_26050 [Acidobacteriota bacterium]